VIIAETQSRGRGRMGREWLSPKGGVWISVVLRPRLSPDEVPKLALMLGVAAAKTLLLEGLECRLKWPNDVLVNDKKVCGILTEIDAELDMVNYIIAGVGINVNNDPMDFPLEFRDTATTLKAELGREVPRAPIVRHFLEELERDYRVFIAGASSTLLEEWRRLSGTLGRKVRIVTHGRTFEGIATNIDDNGALLLRSEDGNTVRILSGDCIHLEEKI
jgi:BirA family biotin operon repressor/biotin-[acetyl-CoA-carboxylase] ligase